MNTLRWSFHIIVFAVPFLPFSGVSFAEYEVVNVTDGATVTGTVTWNGDIPVLPPLKVYADMDVCGEEVESPALRIDPHTRGVQHTLVYLEQIERGKAPASQYPLHMGRHPHRPDSRVCLFEEHVFPFVRTSDVSIVNFEPILHNPHFFDDRQASLFNVALPTPDRTIHKKLTRAQGVGLRLQCDVHVHMNAWAAAFDHPYFAVTDAEGRFSITDVPPGSYTLVMWHEGYKILSFSSSRPNYDTPHVIRQRIDIPPGGRVEVHGALPARPVPLP